MVNFVDSVIVKSKLRVFRFQPDATEPKYFVTPIDFSRLPPFVIARDENNEWKIVGEVSQDILDAEKMFHQIIVENTLTQ